MTPYNPVPTYFNADDEDDLLEPVELDEEARRLDKEYNPKRGQRLGNFVCSFCDKSFRYIKAFNTHVKQHRKGEISPSGNKRRYILKKKKILPEVTYAVEKDDEPEEEPEEEEEDQAPYDSISPYGSPARYDQPAREDSPDFGMLMLNNFHNGDNGVQPAAKKLRMRKQKLPSRSPSREPTPEILKPLPAQPSTSGNSSRGRGRPRKFPAVEMTPQKPKDEPSPFADFCEVDVSSMLKKRVLDNDSFSQSAPSTTQSRSRSASVELIDDFDIFGSVLPDDSASKSAPKAGFGSGTTFACDVRGCNKKFHLRANLKKHQREFHAK